MSNEHSTVIAADKQAAGWSHKTRRTALLFLFVLSMNPKSFSTVAVVLCLAVEAAVAGDSPLRLEQTEIPRDEARQQALLNYREYRFAYSLKATPMNTCLFAECFVEGRLTRRINLTYAMHWEKNEHAKGLISIGWLPRSRELVAINDNGFNSPGFWTSRATLPPDVFDTPSQVVYSEAPAPETRERPPNYPRDLVVYPLMAIAGKRDAATQSSIRPLSTATNFLREAKSNHVQKCIVIYMFFGTAGDSPPLHFDKPPAP